MALLFSTYIPIPVILIKINWFAKEIIHKAMWNYPGRNIVWLDADCVVLNNPDKFDELDKLEHDFAATFMWGRYSRQPLIDGWKVNAHCMFFRNNERHFKQRGFWRRNKNSLQD